MNADADADDDRPIYTGGIGSRREMRERAIALLYEAETKDRPPAEYAHRARSR